MAAGERYFRSLSEAEDLTASEESTFTGLGDSSVRRVGEHETLGDEREAFSEESIDTIHRENEKHDAREEAHEEIR